MTGHGPGHGKAAAPALTKAKADPHQTEFHPAIHMKDQIDKIRNGTITGHECQNCHRQSLTPMMRCTCGSKDIKEASFSSEGAVESFTVQVVASEQFINEVPFAWAIIKLDKGPRVTGWIPYVAKQADLKVGQRVKYTPSYKPGMMFEKA